MLIRGICMITITIMVTSTCILIRRITIICVISPMSSIVTLTHMRCILMMIIRIGIARMIIIIVVVCLIMWINNTMIIMVSRRYMIITFNHVLIVMTFLSRSRRISGIVIMCVITMLYHVCCGKSSLYQHAQRH